MITVLHVQVSSVLVEDGLHLHFKFIKAKLMKGDAPGNIVFDGLLHHGNIPLMLIEELKTSSGTIIIVITTGYYKHGSIIFFN